MSVRCSAWIAVASVIMVAACSNSGADRVLSIRATGIVKGQVYFDLNGDDALDTADRSVANVPIYLLVRGTDDTAATATTSSAGSYRLDGVPVGSYTVVVSTELLADTAVLISSAVTDVSVLPDDSVAFDVGVTYPRMTVAQARTWPLNRRVFVEGVALNSRLTFGDTTVSLADQSGTIRLTQIIAPTFLSGPFAGDSVRVRGTTSTRLGQRTLDRDTVIFIATTFVPAARPLGTADAASAELGLRDAELVVITAAGVNDTITFLGDFKLTVDDGTGPLDVILDRAVFPPFLPTIGPVPYVPGDTLDVVGVLVPTGAGAWRLKPRAVSDIVQR